MSGVKFSNYFCFLLRALSEGLITPLELKMEEWKKVASQLDKDHAKGKTVLTHTRTHTPLHKLSLTRCIFLFFLEYKKARADIKKKSSDTIKLQKKVKKGKNTAPPSFAHIQQHRKEERLIKWSEVVKLQRHQSLFTSEERSHLLNMKGIFYRRT